METVYARRLRDIKSMHKKLEEQLNLKINVKGSKVELSGDALDEYDALRIFEAINFGFSVEKSLLLKNEDFIFKKIHIKEHTKRSLRDVKSRLIGTNGKTRKTLSDISGCEIIVGKSDVGVIGHADSVRDVEAAITSITRGSKQANMYRYLERMNREKKKNREL